MRDDVQEPDGHADEGARHHPRPHQPRPQPKGQGGARREGDQLPGIRHGEFELFTQLKFRNELISKNMGFRILL